MTATTFASTLAQQFVRRHPADAASVLHDIDPDAAAALLTDSGPGPTAAILSRFGPETACRVLLRLPPDQARTVLAHLDPTASAGLLRRLGTRFDTAGLLASLPAANRRELEALMAFPPDAAGSLMDSAAPIFRMDTRAGDVAAAIRESGRTGDLVVLVVDEDLQLLGLLPMVAVLLADPHTRLQDLPVKTTPSVDAFAHRDEVVEVLDTHKLSAMPVVDIHGRAVGVLRHRALAAVAEEDAVTDMQSMVGVSREERALSPVSFAVRKRLPWLQINLATAFLAASVVGFFEATIAQFTALAVLLPVVAGQSGNTGAQSLAVTMRGLTLHEIGLRQWMQVVGKESATGLLNGIAVAIVTMIGVYLWSGSPGLCAVIGLAMVTSMTIAGIAGASVPLVLSAIGQDPAQSSSIVLTTVTDIMGFFSFLGLATLFSSFL
jgi:magnesium transporter